MGVAKEQNPRFGRVTFMYGMVFVGLSSLILRLGYLQIPRGAEFRAQANTTMLARQPVLPSRGWVYDANGVLLAYDQPSFSITVTRLHSNAQNFDDIAAILAPQIGMTKQQFLDVLNSKQNKDQTEVDVYDNADNTQVTFVKEHQSALPGVRVDVQPQRVYKYGDLAGHVLGYVGRQTEQDRPYYANLKYHIDQKVGKDGIEKQYESMLQGQLGYRVVETNIAGIPLKDFGLDPAPTAGRSLQLTIDSGLQAEAQQIVVDELNQVRNKLHYDPKEASAVLINPTDGSLLAMVSYPYYNPQWFMDSKTLTKHWDYLWDSSLTPTLNHVIASRHPPGSTVKPANLLAALANGVIGPTTTILDPGYAMVGTYRAKDDAAGGHGLVDPVKAIEVSCDTFFYNIGMWLADWHGGPPSGESVGTWLWHEHVKGLDTLFGWESMFGLGQKTGIDLPGELSGMFFQDDSSTQTVVPFNLKEAQNAMAKDGYYKNKGNLYNNAFAAIGQMQQFTPIELAQYISTLANGGKRIQPHLLKEVYPPGAVPGDTQGEPVEPKVLNQVKVNPQYLRIVKQGMYDAVNMPGGTAYGSFYNAPYKAAGKTGTAQVGQGKEDTSVFMAYAPANKPQVAVVVMVPGGGGSYDTAVPMARALLDAYFKEHHSSFFPKDQWTNPGPPNNWFQMPAYTVAENAKGTKRKSK